MSIENAPTVAQQVEVMGPSNEASVPAAISKDEYEFSPYENVVIGTLARRMRLLAWLIAAFTAIQVLAAAVAVRIDPTLVIRAAIGAAVTAILSAMLLRSAKEFRAITETEHNDLRHLMTALGNLSQFFLVECVCFAIFFALLLITVLMVVTAYV